MTETLSTTTYGTVILQDWFEHVDGRQYVAVTGLITVLAAKELLGHDVNSRDSNWMVRVVGKTYRFNIPGCQIRIVVEHPDTEEPPARGRVLLT